MIDNFFFDEFIYLRYKFYYSTIIIFHYNKKLIIIWLNWIKFYFKFNKRIYFKYYNLNYLKYIFYIFYFFEINLKMSSQNDVQNAQELTEFVKGLLNQMNERFKTMTDSIVGRYIIFFINI